MSRNAEKVFEEADEETEDLYDFIRDAAEWFHINEGEMFTREEARENLMDELNISSELANRLIGELVEDEVDPVVQVNAGEKSFVGVAEYEEFELAYGYIDYDDVTGKQKKVVCARCVETADQDSEVAHAVSQNTDSEYEPLLSQIKNHFSNMHDTRPAGVKTGATLAAGTTIGGSRVATRNWADNNYVSKNSDGKVQINASNDTPLTVNRPNNRSIGSSDSWLAIDGGSNGILLNYYDQNEVRIGNGSMDGVGINLNPSGSHDLETNGSARFDGGVWVTGSGRHSYNGISSGTGNNGHLMLDSNGGNLYLNWEETSGQVRLEGSKVRVDSWLDMQNNRIHDVQRINFNNREHSDLNDRSIGWDNSEGGGDVSGGFIFQDNNGNNRYIVNSSSRDYNIEKNGNDKNGVINFKT